MQDKKAGKDSTELEAVLLADDFGLPAQVFGRPLVCIFSYFVHHKRTSL